MTIKECEELLRECPDGCARLFAISQGIRVRKQEGGNVSDKRKVAGKLGGLAKAAKLKNKNETVPVMTNAGTVGI